MGSRVVVIARRAADGSTDLARCWVDDDERRARRFTQEFSIAAASKDFTTDSERCDTGIVDMWAASRPVDSQPTLEEVLGGFRDRG